MGSIAKSLQVIGGLVMVYMLMIFAFAVYLLGLQIIGWMQHAAWQKLPLGALFLSEQGKAVMMVYIDNPLDRLPDGIAWTIEDAARNIAPNALGVQEIVAWMLNLPFVLVSTVFSTLILAVMLLLHYWLEPYAER